MTEHTIAAPTSTVISYQVLIDGEEHSLWRVLRSTGKDGPLNYWVESNHGYRGGTHDNYLSAVHEAKSMTNVIRDTEEKRVVVVKAY